MVSVRYPAPQAIGTRSGTGTPDKLADGSEVCRSAGLAEDLGASRRVAELKPIETSCGPSLMGNLVRRIVLFAARGGDQGPGEGGPVRAVAGVFYAGRKQVEEASDGGRCPTRSLAHLTLFAAYQHQAAGPA